MDVLKRIFAQLDIFVSLLIVGIVIIMVMPIPTFLLDFLQFLNLAVALIVLLSTLYVKRALDISSFPSLILVTTLFRLALNIASTRLILLEGKDFDGQVIKAFGDFAVGGNYIVGIIIFLVITLVNFMVITKGSSRISEVAARFTLDAMPGKQMSIDADMSAGIISEEEAKKRREDVRREADFYGAMDGASKFVSGDAVAGLIITFINILGGLLIGMFQQGLDAATAASLFTLLTIGDGLVTSIPALLVSTASGMIVSRTASKDNFGRDIIDQLSSDKKVLSISGFVIIALGLFTPLPKIPALFLGGGTLALAYFSSRREKNQMAFAGGYMQSGKPGTYGSTPALNSQMEMAQQPVRNIPTTPPLTTADEISEIIQNDTIEVDIGYGLIPLADPSQGGDLLERITMVRKQVAFELGIVIAPVRIRDSVLLSSNEYVIKLKGVEIGRFELIPDRLLAINSGMAAGPLDGYQSSEPAFGLMAFWILEEQKDDAITQGYTVVDAPSVFATHLSELIKRYAHEIVGIREIEMLIDGLRVKNSTIVDTLIPGLLKLHELRKILQRLLYERISIRNLPIIFESLIEATDKYGKDEEILISNVRLGLGRQICDSLKSSDSQLHVIALDASIERKILDAITDSENGRFLALEPEYANVLIEKISKGLEEIMMKGYNPVLICSQSIRYQLSTLCLRFVQNINIIAYEEVPHDVSLSVEGIVNF